LSHWETYQLLYRCLAQYCGQGSPELGRESPDWPALIEASRAHVVTPALAWSLWRNENVPADADAHLKAAFILNTRRNTLLLGQVESVARALNGIGVTPVLLKGAALLTEQLYPHVGIRFLSDLDMLIPRDRSNDASECVRALGHTVPKPSAWTEGASHHLPSHIDNETGTSLELHLQAVVPSFARLLPTEHVFAHATPSSFRNTSVLLPSPTDQVAHNIVHSQIVDRLHLRGTVSLRWLLDFALLCRRYEADIDWDELARRFRDTRNTPVLERIVALGHELFSLPRSVPKIGNGVSALRMLQQTVDNPNRQTWGILTTILERHVQLFRAAPSQHLSLIDPRTWPRRFATFRRILRTPPRW
jgi:hypothetical protein